MNKLAENLWEWEQPLNAPGLHMGHRMTIIRLSHGGLWVHSPIECNDLVRQELARLGPVHSLIAPNRFHDLFWGDWFKHYPEACFYCVPGMKEEHPQLPFQKVLRPETREPWEDEIQKIGVRGMPRINEFVFLHRASRTLIVADLVFNLDANKQNFLGKLFLKLNGIYDRVGCSRIFRTFIKNRTEFRASIAEILECDFDRLIPGHGKIIGQDGKNILQRVMKTLK